MRQRAPIPNACGGFQHNFRIQTPVPFSYPGSLQGHYDDTHQLKAYVQVVLAYVFTLTQVGQSDGIYN